MQIRRFNKNDLVRIPPKGFTLVELVVVVLVLGIIAAVAAPKLFNTTANARDNTTVQSLAVMRDAIELHLAQNGAYPGDGGTQADFQADLAPFLKGPFPRSQLTLAAKDGTVAVETDGGGLGAVSGAQDWRYDNQDGSLGINLSGYENF